MILSVGTAVSIGTALHSLAEDQSQWSQATFGTDAEKGPEGALAHLAKEAAEAGEAWGRFLQSRADDTAGLPAAERRDAFGAELADCLLLILDASRRGGFNVVQLLTAALLKMDVVRSRHYPRWTFAPAEVYDGPRFNSSTLKVERVAFVVRGELGNKWVEGYGHTSAEALADARRVAQAFPVEHVRPEEPAASSPLPYMGPKRVLLTEELRELLGPVNGGEA